MVSEYNDDYGKWMRFKSGDELAISAIYSENAKSLYQYGLKFTTNLYIIEDTIHDVFLDLIKNRKTIGETKQIRFYLLKTFRRKLIRKLGGESRYGDFQSSELKFDVQYSIEHEIIKDETNKKVLSQLYEAIKKLSPRQQEAIYLKYKKELDYTEISLIMDMSVEASRNLIYRAIKSLREILVNSADGIILFVYLKQLKKI